MATNILSAVFDMRGLHPAERLVLLRLAEVAHSDGSNAFLSVDTIAEDSEIDRRTVQRVLRKFTDSGVLSVQAEAKRWRPTVYRFHIGARVVALPVSVDDEAPDHGRHDAASTKQGAAQGRHDAASTKQGAAQGRRRGGVGVDLTPPDPDPDPDPINHNPPLPPINCDLADPFLIELAPPEQEVRSALHKAIQSRVNGGADAPATDWASHEVKKLLAAAGDRDQIREVIEYVCNQMRPTLASRPRPLEYGRKALVTAIERLEANGGKFDRGRGEGGLRAGGSGARSAQSGRGRTGGGYQGGGATARSGPARQPLSDDDRKRFGIADGSDDPDLAQWIADEERRRAGA